MALLPVLPKRVSFMRGLFMLRSKLLDKLYIFTLLFVAVSFLCVSASGAVLLIQEHQKFVVHTAFTLNAKTQQ